MKKRYIIANWKSYKDTNEAKKWVEALSRFRFPPVHEIELVVCPSFSLLPQMKKTIRDTSLPISLGTQDISQFGEGSFTGAVNAKQAIEYATYAIIGHSERRKYFHETDMDVLAKLKAVLDTPMTPVLCISDLKQMEFYLEQGTLVVDKADKIIFVYEPPSAISGGGNFHPESPEKANENAEKMQKMIGKEVTILYGGSVNPEIAQELFKQPHIMGGLVGKASLDPAETIQLLQSF